jgi:hypothetical protein
MESLEENESLIWRAFFGTNADLMTEWCSSNQAGKVRENTPQRPVNPSLKRRQADNGGALPRPWTKAIRIREMPQGGIL